MRDLLTKQEIFDQVARHLLTQNERAISSNGNCQYHSKDGLKCAVGALIPDNLYNQAFENRKVGYLLAAWKEIMRKIGLDEKEHALLLYALQGIHDCTEPCVWRGQLERVAQKFELSDSVLSTIK